VTSFNCEESVTPRDPLRNERISGVIDGQVVSVTDTPLLTSANTGWSGFLLEEIRADLARDRVMWGWHKTHVCLVTEGSHEFILNIGGRRERVVVCKGDIYIFPAGFGEAEFEYDGSKCQGIVVEIDPERFRALSQPLPHTALRPQLGISDTAIAHLLSNMKDEVAIGCPNGRLYHQSLSIALAAYVNGRFALNPREPSVVGRISVTELRLLEEFVRAHIASNLSLTELASVIGMSARTFSRVFGRSFGCTPYKYLMEQRMGLAKSLLKSDKPIAEVAKATGFTPSHFSTAFKKAFGVSPGQWRSEHCSRSRPVMLSTRPAD
jgi:AraC family transcriptional regulator